MLNADNVSNAIIQIGNFSFCRAYISSDALEALRRAVYDAPTSTDAARLLHNLAVSALAAARKPPSAVVCRALLETAKPPELPPAVP